MSRKPVGVRNVFDIEVADTHNFVANGIVVHNCTSRGAQKFFEEAKPKSIIDIAVLTSIYRPGPLAAKLNKLWIDVINGKEYDWGDRRINKILEKTKGLLIFQEGVMELAEKVAGFPKDKCDEVRRAIMKRSISGGDAAKAKVDEMKSSFVDGAIANGYTRAVAENVYEKVCFFSGYGFNACVSGRNHVDIVSSTSSTLADMDRTLISCQVKDVKPGDQVLSRDERTKQTILTTVKRVHRNGVRPMVKVTLRNGTTTVCTMSHKFRTTCGHVLSLAEILRRGLSLEERV